MKLSDTLRRAYKRGKDNRAVVLEMNLFGIEHAATLRSSMYSIDKLITDARIPDLASEIRQGIKLSDYVVLKGD